MPNLLHDPLIRAATADGRRQTITLPQTLHLLAQDQISCFQSLRPHQEHPWHAFLTQTAVLALQHAGLDTLPGGPEGWRDRLAHLTQGDEPWELVNDDLSRPAFMQNPVPDPEAIAKRGKICLTPDGIDILFASKNFETKQDLIWNAQPDHWLYALITAQTAAAYAGAGHPGASRMNGGYSARPAVSLAPHQGGPGAHWRRDTEILRHHPDYQGDTARAVLWTIPWAGQKNEAMDPDALHPLYLEVCRRIRLSQTPDGRIHARKGTAAGAIVDAKSKNGVTRDPWTPLARTAAAVKPLHIQKDGFTHRLLTAIMLERDRWDLPCLLQPTPQELRQGAATLVARGIAGGKCETNGYHQTAIPLSPPLLQALADPAKAAEAQEIAAERQEQIRAMRGCLAAALETALHGPQNGGLNRDPIRRAAAPLEQSAQLRLIDGLQQELLQPTPAARQEARQEWLAGPEGLAETARRILAAAPARSDDARAAARTEFETRTGRPKPLAAYRVAQPVPNGAGRPATAKPGPEAFQAIQLADRIAAAAAEYPNSLVRLRRLNPDDPGPQEFERLTAGLWEIHDRPARRRWALIIHGIALMTATHHEHARYRPAHTPRMPLGRAITGYTDRGQRREMLTPDQARRLIHGPEPELRPLAVRLFQNLARAGLRLDWAETAQLILHPEDRRIRAKISEDYERAHRRSQPHD